MNLPAIREAANQRLHDLLAHLLPAGTPRGNEYLIGDEHGAAGDSCSIVLTGDRVGLWHDHASGHGGDVLDLVAVHHGPTVGHAARWLATWLGRPELLNGDAAAEWTPHDARWKRPEDAEWSAPQAVYTYRDRAGAVLGYVCRYPNGKGIPLGLNRKHKRWWSKPAPLYGAQDLNDDRPILVVEGEKTRDAAAKLFRDHAVVTWPGGSTAVCDADWSALAGRTVVIWPDADKPGRRAANYLKSRFPDARVIPTEDLPDGWDLADEPPAGFDPVGRLHAEPVGEPPPSPEPYRVLGMRDGDAYFHSLSTGDIIHFPPTGLTELNLQLLADDDYWMSKGYMTKSMDVDYKSVAKILIKQARELGVFDPDCIRGLGCWMDEGRVIYHAGDRLYVDGRLTPLHSLKSRFIYIARKPVPFNPDVVLTAEQGRKLAAACDLLPWGDGAHSWALPSFLFLSHLCGVLGNRPHGWLVGGQGSGKSYCCSNLIDPLIGRAAVKALSGSTAPGIRQAVGCDAVAVFGDEFEGKDQQTRDRLRAITELGRQSYVETGWATLHGTASGDGKQYRTRSMFFFSSIAASVLESADLARFVVLEFRKRDDPEAFRKLKQAIADTVGQPGFAEAFAARAVKLAPLVLKAIDVFRAAIQKTCGDSRKADTFGTLAGGRWMLESDTVPTQQQAESWAATVKWDNEGAGSDSDSDPARVLEIILQHNHRIQDADGRYQDMTVGEMLHAWFDRVSTDSGMRKACHASLLSIGIHPVRVSGENHIDIAKSHPELSRIFKNTPYGDLYPQYLRRPPMNAVDAQYTPTGCTTKRAVRLKYDPPAPDQP